MMQLQEKLMDCWTTPSAEGQMMRSHSDSVELEGRTGRSHQAWNCLPPATARLVGDPAVAACPKQEVRLDPGSSPRVGL